MGREVLTPCQIKITQASNLNQENYHTFHEILCQSISINAGRPEVLVKFFISPPNVYMSNTGLVPGSTGGYTARWCQRAV